MAKLAGSAPLSPDVCALARLRTVLVSGAALSLLAGLGSTADAAPRYFSPYGWYGGGWYLPPAGPSTRKAWHPPNRRENVEPTKDAGFGEMPKGPLQLVVSINDQKVTLFSNGVRVAQGPVSTGVPGHPTPMGVFSIIEKDRYHHSNIYSAAPMPYMQRITWSGVALHEGVLPGYPASHGCIRMSHDFAQKLWPVTKLGVRVIVARNQLAPVEFEHSKLFAPKLKPAAPQAAAASDGGRSVAPMRLAQATPTDAEGDAAKAVPDVPPIESAPDVNADRNSAVATPLPERAQVAAPAAPVETTRVGAQPRPVDAEAPSKGDVDTSAPVIDPPKPIAPRLKAADQPVKRSGQVAVFVSRKEMKMFVRQGFVPLFDAPITIDEPDRPLGTHVFTAMSLTDDGEGMRWNLMTVPTDQSAPTEARDGRRRASEPVKPIARAEPASTASQALNRIHMPKEAVDRIDELLIPGSSLVISDDGLGRETGRYTEFIVVTR